MARSARRARSCPGALVGRRASHADARPTDRPDGPQATGSSRPTAKSCAISALAWSEVRCPVVTRTRDVVEPRPLAAPACPAGRRAATPRPARSTHRRASVASAADRRATGPRAERRGAADRRADNRRSGDVDAGDGAEQRGVLVDGCSGDRGDRSRRLVVVERGEGGTHRPAARGASRLRRLRSPARCPRAAATMPDRRR